MRRIFVLIAIFSFAWATCSRAEDDNDPCALQRKASANAVGTSAYDGEAAVYKKCMEIAEGQKKVDYAATRFTWAASLDKLPGGGWILLDVNPDGTYAAFASHRHAMRSGNIVSVWVRFEYREERYSDGDRYKSLVEREMYDCAGVRSKTVATSLYSENNLAGHGPSYTYDEDKASWSPAIPGTLGDFLLDWACKAVPKGQPAKASQ